MVGSQPIKRKGEQPLLHKRPTYSPIYTLSNVDDRFSLVKLIDPPLLYTNIIASFPACLQLCLTIFGLGLMSSLSDSKEIDVSNLVCCGWKRK